jgi:Cu2+-containing amine oxidase
MTTAEHVRGVRHPLEPLTAEEIETASQILKRDRGLADSARFVYVTLRSRPRMTSCATSRARRSSARRTS